jgi:hypothetical protein
MLPNGSQLHSTNLLTIAYNVEGIAEVQELAALLLNKDNKMP